MDIEASSTALDVTVQDGRVALRGQLDMATVPRLREAFDALLQRPVAADIVVDLAELTFCDSTGLTEFVRTEHALESVGRQLRLRRPTPPIRQILSITHLDAALDVD